MRYTSIFGVSVVDHSAHYIKILADFPELVFPSQSSCQALTDKAHHHIVTKRPPIASEQGDYLLINFLRQKSFLYSLLRITSVDLPVVPGLHLSIWSVRRTMNGVFAAITVD